MVLTHLDPGDIDADSLPYMSKNLDSFGNNDTAYERGISESFISLRKSSSETALNSSTSCESTNSSPISKSKPSKEGKPSDCDSRFSGSSVTEIKSLETELDIKFIQSTPDPRVKIGVIHPTPVKENKVLSNPNQTASFSEPSKKLNGNRKIPFKLSDTSIFPDYRNGFQSKQRNTSTPKRSDSSPVPQEELSKDLFEDVFETSKTNLDTTCNLSPISLKVGRSGSKPGDL